MLPCIQRLNLKKSFKWVRDGKRSEGSLVRMFTRFGENESALVGVAISKDFFKKAVERNLAKRKVFASFQKIYQDLPKGLNVVVIPKTGVLQVDQGEIDKEVKELLK